MFALYINSLSVTYYIIPKLSNHSKITCIQIAEKNNLTGDGVSKLLPVAPDIARPHSREVSDPRIRGARQDKGPLPPHLHKSSEGWRQKPRVNMHINKSQRTTWQLQKILIKLFHPSLTGGNSGTRMLRMSSVCRA